MTDFAHNPNSNKRTQETAALEASQCSWYENPNQNLSAGNVALFSPLQQNDALMQGVPYRNELCIEASQPLAINRNSKAFPQLLHKMLEDAEHKGFQNIVSWQPHGRAFRVHDKKKFVKEILSKYFRQTQFTSFQRQLNLYCFQRLTIGNDKGASYHELFRRDQPHLSRQMVRKRIKGNGARAATDAESEPNFYSSQCSEFAIQPTADLGSFAASGTGLDGAFNLYQKPNLQLQSISSLSYTSTTNANLVSLYSFFLKGFFFFFYSVDVTFSAY